MRVIPPYTQQHTGTALICGPAPSLFADFEKARAAFPDAALIAINWAIRAVRAQHLISQHYELADVFRGMGRHDHPGHDFKIHSQPPHHFDGGMEKFPNVDHFWEVARESSNSAVAAAKIALLGLGFERVVFCGVLLDGTPGYAIQTGHAVFWQGGVSATAGELVMAEFIRPDNMEIFAGKVFAMSGAPRKLFGLPPGVA